MAQYKHLPIYKATYDLLELITRETKNFPRDFRHTLGARLHEEAINMVVLIYKANSASTGRAAIIGQMLDQMQVATLLLRLAKDMRLLSLRKFSNAVELTDSISRQASGWAKSARAES